MNQKLATLKCSFLPLITPPVIDLYLTSLERKTIIFDMDETLIHCVDDIENEDPDVIIPI